MQIGYDPAQIALVQVIADNGQFSPSSAARQFLDRLDQLSLTDMQLMYEQLRTVRALDLEAANLQRAGQLGIWVPCRGQEAAQIGAAWALRDQDMTFPAYREHAFMLARGVDFMHLIKLFRGVTFSGWDIAKYRIHAYSLVIGVQTLHAVGYGMGIRLEGRCGSGDLDRDEAVLVHFGDGATSQGDTSESLVFAARYQAPVVFFLQNNQWAISVPSTTPGFAAPLCERGRGFGVPGVRVDGNDPLATYAVCAELLDRARLGGGPQWIEAYTYRLGAHTSSDDPTRYQDPKDYEAWLKKDPLIKFRTYLLERGVDQDWFKSRDELALEQASRLRQETLALPEPDLRYMFKHPYSAAHPVISAQEEWCLNYERTMRIQALAKAEVCERED